MQNLRLSEERFNALKDRIVRDFRNFPKQDAFRIAQFYNDEVLNRFNYRPEDRLAIAEELTLEDIEQFAAELYGQVFIEALVHGNISDEKTIELTRKLQKQLGVQTIDRQSTFTQTYLSQPDSEEFVRVEKLEVNNSCFWREYDVRSASYGTQSRLYTVLVESYCGRMATSTSRNVSKNASIIEGTKSTSCHCIVSKNIQCKGHNFIKKYRKDLTKVRIILVMTETFLLAIFYTTPNYW